MEIKILKTDEQHKYYDEILKMLIDGDEEFVPPLSARNYTTQADLTSATKNSDGILSYFEEMKKQRIMVATENDTLLTFVSFRENYTNNEIKGIPNISVYTNS